MFNGYVQRIATVLSYRRVQFSIVSLHCLDVKSSLTAPYSLAYITSDLELHKQKAQLKMCRIRSYISALHCEGHFCLSVGRVEMNLFDWFSVVCNLAPQISSTSWTINSSGCKEIMFT